MNSPSSNGHVALEVNRLNFYYGSSKALADITMRVSQPMMAQGSKARSARRIADG